MAITHNLGFPRIGSQRELKFALEDFWQGNKDENELTDIGQTIRATNWDQQSQLDLVPVGDFSFYDQVLDTSFLLGNVPERAEHTRGSELDRYFRVARGRTANDGEDDSIAAGEMTKWFDTNYHYIVPEVNSNTRFELNEQQLLGQLEELKSRGLKAKPVVVGPVTYLWLSKAKDGSHRIDLLDCLIPVYQQLLDKLDDAGVEWVQIDEPILVTELEAQWQQAIRQTYQQLQHPRLKILLATYFGTLQENLSLTCQLPVAGLHVDAIRGREEVEEVVKQLPDDRVLSLGIIDGRNIWKTDLEAVLNWLEPIDQQLGDRLWLAPACSLLHVPVDLEIENELDDEIKSWLAFACQKLEELQVLCKAINQGRDAVSEELEANRLAIKSRRKSARVNNPEVQQAQNSIIDSMGQRQSSYPQRAARQAERLNLPRFPTTTIGSFPQTTEIRKARLAKRKNQLETGHYTAMMQQEIIRAIREQEKLGLDVLVHGEAERNDMVEYFGEQLEGYAFTRFGWVQSYGSRCVKPPLLFGDISRPKPMTVDWTRFASSQTDKPMKGMLTGPVTILNWSFVRDDQPRSKTCQQLALAVREEVLDLEKAGINIIQIDEAALREGLPLRRSQWQEYLDWAVGSYRIAANGVADETQIHTHMCYSEFNDIIEAIADMDADVITIETSRSDMELLDVFERFEYPNEIGPGVYDIHSPNIPSVEQMVDLMQKAAERIPAERLWVNPDCGLKTRQWDEVLPALKNMVAASRQLREQVVGQSSH